MKAHAPPAYMMTPELTDLSRFPEFHHARRVDSLVRTRQGAVVDLRKGLSVAQAQAVMGPQARGHLGILDYHRGDFSLADYQRGEWAVVKNQFRSALMRVGQFRFSVEAADDFTYNDDGGNARTLRGRAVSTPSFPTQQLTDNAQHQFKYGSSNTAEPGTSNNILVQLGQTIVAGSLAYDDVNFRVNASGSRIHTEAGATIAEIADFNKYSNTAGSVFLFMCDRTVIANTAVATNQTVAVSYQWQY